ncbi:MAG: sigma-70 family RNA polymerase sigma factor [Opitutales bacterium]
MNCPDTPVSVISDMLKKEHTATWHSAWKVFYEIYYSTILAMAKNEFSRIYWKASEVELAEVISATVLSIVDIFKRGKYVKGYKFRGFLKKIVARRVIDYVRSQNKKRTVSIEAMDLLDALNASDSNIERGKDFFEKLEEDEAREYRKSVVMDAWENIRLTFSSQTALIFEMSQLEEKSVAEISKLLKVEREIINGAVHRVLKKLKEKLSETDYKKELEL